MTRALVVALSLIVAASPVSAAIQEPTPAIGAPEGTPNTRYCLRVDPFTGSRIETIRCWTRQEWEDQGVDVDQEWAENGVRVVNGA